MKRILCLVTLALAAQMAVGVYEDTFEEAVRKYMIRAIVPYAHNIESMLILRDQANEILNETLLTKSCASLPQDIEELELNKIDAETQLNAVYGTLKSLESNALSNCTSSDKKPIDQLECFYGHLESIKQAVDDAESAAHTYVKKITDQFTNVRRTIWYCIGNTTPLNLTLN